ncbi:DNA mismatch repair protein MutS [Ichthyobacterium seriolicida]|uniref:DNA mismatch repair protein MutS n=1 Tax=Ichthyobacterium seriolicida TaxID=242600 RepID=A0A1J1E306_9FLAO|nr:DNA mismatch repair protein MutS [Ichthyobacterium seriolicida]BAV95341.1 DNA mismatch repair protein MutS [Ichthyobacterium seriolicida]
MQTKKVTPLMRQYSSIKAKHPDAMLLFRVGDFYETFGADAVECSRILGIVLTSRSNGSASEVELAGFPHHSLDNYLPKLVKAGKRVAVCDQLEDPKMAKTIVKRGVTELVTPGVTFNDQVLQSKTNNFLASVFFDKDKIGISLLDISTGEFLISEGNADYIDKILKNFNPSEVLFIKAKESFFKENFGDKYYHFALEDWVYQFEYAHEKLLDHFNVASLKGFGIDKLNSGIIASGAILHYLSETQHNRLKHITSIKRIKQDKYMWVDSSTIKNLELVNPINRDGHTLLEIIDKTISPMGARLMNRWIMLPLKDIAEIKKRQYIVSFFVQNQSEIDRFSCEIKLIGDVERLVSKISTEKISPREAVQLKRSAVAIMAIKEMSSKIENEIIKHISLRFTDCSLLIDKITSTLNDDAPVNTTKGGAIKSGISKELDELRYIAFSGKEYLREMTEREIKATGISSLKISFNNVFGYYIEVRNTHKDKVPEDWIRKQTLVSSERYITKELKEYEEKILNAESEIIRLEQSIFSELINFLSDYIDHFQNNAKLISLLDCCISMAKVSLDNDYVLPEIDDSLVLDIKQGRHPVIEKQLPLEQKYVANDLYLDNTDQQIIMITGPNMSGKSAILRQTALIVLLAQIGCYVPAKSARIGIVDKLFTRVGASDNISSGESTFMVEMNESANILNNISQRSLILLDEIGRGTSTYDGISIAWAISEYLHDHKDRPKTLFATHYHELNKMTEKFERIKNYTVSIKELEDRVLFMRKLIPGGSQHSFGIHVAKMAGMPSSVIDIANDILEQLERSRSKDDIKISRDSSAKEPAIAALNRSNKQLDAIKGELQDIDINALTPIESMLKLIEIRKKVLEN